MGEKYEPEPDFRLVLFLQEKQLNEMKSVNSAVIIFKNA